MEKKNVGLVVLVIILSLLVLGLGGFVVYDKVLSDDKIENSDNDNSNVNEEKEEELSLSNQIVGLLYSKINYLSSDSNELNSYNRLLFYDGKNVTINTLSNEDILLLTYSQLELDSSLDFKINYFEQEMKELFGRVLNYKKENFDINCESYEYSSEYDGYRGSQGGCGGPGNVYLEKRLYKAVKKTDSLEIYEKYALLNYLDTRKKLGIYSTSGFDGLIHEFDKDDKYNEFSFDEYIDIMPMIKYTFNLSEDGNYYFYSSEVIM